MEFGTIYMYGILAAGVFSGSVGTWRRGVGWGFLCAMGAVVTMIAVLIPFLLPFLGFGIIRLS